MKIIIYKNLCFHASAMQQLQCEAREFKKIETNCIQVNNENVTNTKL